MGIGGARRQNVGSMRNQGADTAVSLDILARAASLPIPEYIVPIVRECAERAAPVLSMGPAKAATPCADKRISGTAAQARGDEHRVAAPLSPLNNLVKTPQPE